LTKLADDTREEIAEKNRRVSDGTFRAVFDPTETYVAPKPEAPAPYLNFAPLQNGLARLQESTKNYQAALSSPAAQERLRSRETQAALDEILRGVEQAMTRDSGLPRRPWFKHQIYAPGFYTGYGVKTLPGVREAVEQHNWKEAEEQVGVAANTIEQVAAQIDRATALLQGGR
jgi:N-acetylated-alpha-linked acidic dipeptidase